MDTVELLNTLERLLSASKVGVFTTVDAEGFPRSRWMTPALMKGRPGFLYAITAPDSAKAKHIAGHPQVEWTFQSKVLNEVLSVFGTASLVMEPQAKAEVLEAIGPNLQIFWRVNPNSKNWVVVETAIKELTCFYPMRNERHRSEVR